jgi:hypothetical protein
MGDNFTIDTALPFGEMPAEAIISKFEETDTGESEYTLEAYQRETLADFRPDPRSFEQDQPQTNNQSAGFLNQRYTGTRSGQEVHQPELFLGFHGPEDRDPRRTFTDPDFDKLKEQHEARTKYVRWDADADNSITGGGWREDQVQAGKQYLIKSAKQRTKVFSTSKDGKRNGMNRSWEHRSVAENVDGKYEDMSDFIRDSGITPQRKTVILSNLELSSGKFYNRHIPDHEFTVARYGDNPRSAVLVSELGSKALKYDGEAATGESDESVAYKTMGVLMSKIVEQKHKADQDTETTESAQSRAYKHALLTDDLTKLTHALGSKSHDADFKNSDNSFTSKSLTPGKNHASDKGVANHAKPDHLYLSAELMYKSVQPGADTVKIKRQIERMNTSHELREGAAQSRKNNHATENTRNKKSRTQMKVDGESLATVNYKTNLQNTKHSKKKHYNGESVLVESDPTPIYKTSNEQYRITQKDDVENDMRFLEYETAERHTAPMGSKFVRNKAHEDSLMGDIAAMS